MNTLLKLVQVVYAVWLAFWNYRAARRVDTVRADPGSEWMRKFGGADQRNERAPSGSDDAGGRGD